jgi:hypothetical protein
VVSVTAKPGLPDGYDLPAEVNGWRHDPDSGRNGHVWTAADAPKSLGVFAHVGRICVKVFDDRVDGFENNVAIHEQDVPEDGPAAPRAVGLITDAVDVAIRWMDHTPPADWEHLDVEEAVFDAPVGFVLDRYYLEEREHIVCYRQEGTEKAVNLSGRPPDTEPSLETRKYLYVEAWRGSGNATVALAPWLRAHDHEKHEVVDTPPECGLAVALTLAREWVREQTGVERESRPAGQADLTGWSA